MTSQTAPATEPGVTTKNSPRTVSETVSRLTGLIDGNPRQVLFQLAATVTTWIFAAAGAAGGAVC